jgi:SAM-dependent methyltransferase
MPDPQRIQRLKDFVAWSNQHITGDEKGQAQIFLDHLFRAFGHDGVLDAGASYEERIKKTNGGTAFADCVWKPHVLIEMKKRGVDLATAYQQAFDYWTRLVPNRPNYVVLCNFDEFWVYDFDIQVDTPVDKVQLADLPERFGPLAFLYPTHEEPTFGNNNEKVTREAADRLALLFNKLIARDIDRPTAQRFVLQCLVALFAEDIGLMPQYTFARVLEDCDTPEKAYDLIGGLFNAMNTEGVTAGGRFAGVDYFNGGVFAQPVSLELAPDELNQLKEAAKEDWSKVRPEIFGTIFEHSLDTDERHAFGAHFTSGVDIMKIVRPTITAPWQQAIAKANTLKALRELHQRMQHYRVLDPACGSGNFLYLAYRELKRLEKQLIDKLADVSKKQSGDQMQFSFVTARQFYGMDINPFAVELAKVTMMIARKLAIDELHMDEQALPLDNLDDNFRACDALITIEGGAGILPAVSPQAESGNESLGAQPQRRAGSPPHQSSMPHPIQIPWPEADVIIGNPPFLGAKRLKPEHGADYVNTVRKLYPDVPGMADFCVYWFRRSHDHLPVCTKDDPVAGRAGLVGTQNIRNNKSREGGLDHIVKSGTIVEAVDNQPWSGEANVHVSIANWVKTSPSSAPNSRRPTDAGQENEDADTDNTPASASGVRRPPAISQDSDDINPADLFIPAKKKLWFKLDTKPAKRNKRGQGPANKQYELDSRETEHINAALSDQTDVTAAKVLLCNKKPKVVYQGLTHGHEGFLLTPFEAKRMIDEDLSLEEVIFPYLTGRELLAETSKPQRYVIDFQQRNLLEAKAFSDVFDRIKQSVLPHRKSEAEKGKDANGQIRPHHKRFLENWWKLSWSRPELVEKFQELGGRYLGLTRNTTEPIFVFISTDIRPSDVVQIFAFGDDYSFACLQNHLHHIWMLMKGSDRGTGPRYTPDSVFDTFPWPQSPLDKDVEAAAEAGRQVRAVRDEALTQLKGGLRALYRTLELPGKNPLKDAHAALDDAVMKCYGFSKKKDLLQQLLDLNLEVADREKRGDAVTAPGIPASYKGARDALVTDDCIRP